MLENFERSFLGPLRKCLKKWSEETEADAQSGKCGTLFLWIVGTHYFSGNKLTSLTLVALQTGLERADNAIDSLTGGNGDS